MAASAFKKISETVHVQNIGLFTVFYVNLVQLYAALLAKPFGQFLSDIANNDLETFICRMI